METMLQAVARLRSTYYPTELRAEPGGILRCGACDQSTDAGRVTVDETARFEGDSTPEDESILLAITMSCGHRGLYSAAFGPATPADDAEVLRGLATS